jgi:putative redox protein
VKTVRHVARAVGTTAATAATAYRVDLRAGAHVLVADEPTDTGGGDTGPNPFGLLVSGLAACTATTLRMHAERKGWELTALRVDVRYNVDDDAPGAIARTITVGGRPSGRAARASRRHRRADPGDPRNTRRHADHDDVPGARRHLKAQPVDNVFLHSAAGVGRRCNGSGARRRLWSAVSTAVRSRRRAPGPARE